MGTETFLLSPLRFFFFFFFSLIPVVLVNVAELNKNMTTPSPPFSFGHYNAVAVAEREYLVRALQKPTGNEPVPRICWVSPAKTSGKSYVGTVGPML
jgi:hypothetical protein